MLNQAISFGRAFFYLILCYRNRKFLFSAKEKLKKEGKKKLAKNQK